MLFDLLYMLKDKITKFLYSTLTYCVQDNDAAQEIGRATGEYYKILYVRLRDWFQKHVKVEKKSHRRNSKS